MPEEMEKVVCRNYLAKAGETVEKHSDNDSSIESRYNDVAVGYVPDEQLADMHAYKLQVMPDSEVDCEHYKIQYHYIKIYKLCLVINDLIITMPIFIEAH